MIRPLAWDSDFFEMKVGEVSVSSADSLPHGKFDIGAYELVYVFSDYPLDFLKISPADIKVIYGKRITGTKEDLPNHIFPYKEDTSIGQVYDLAISSGHQSRFNLDPRIPIPKFEEMYRLWVDKILRSSNGKIFCCKTNDQITGMIACSIKKPESKIELIAVHTKSQGKSIGANLIKYSEHHAMTKQSEFIRVATQKQNTGACLFYEKMGYSVQETKYIYHLWNTP